MRFAQPLSCAGATLSCLPTLAHEEELDCFKSGKKLVIRHCFSQIDTPGGANTLA
jgi:hypothetical protein